jgi:hypothetical protein
MCVVTNRENDEMRPLRGRGPEERYAKIDVLELKDGVWKQND